MHVNLGGIDRSRSDGIQGENKYQAVFSRYVLMIAFSFAWSLEIANGHCQIMIFFLVM